MSFLKFTTLTRDKNITSSISFKKNLGDHAFERMNTKVFFAGLFIFQLLLTFQGIDLSDEGFLAIFYQRIFSNSESVQYNFMFWLTGIIGGIYYKLFSFLGLWGLRLAGVLITTGTAMLTYSLLKKYLNPNYLKLGLFLIVITLNNDIKELNYNNLSALCYVTIIYLLVDGLKQQSNFKLFFCGLFISLNFFIRPPNILELGLFLAIVYDGYEKKRGFTHTSRQIFIFISGFAVCTVAVLFAIRWVGHWEIYENALQVLYKMGKATPHANLQKGDYGIFKLIKQLKSNNAKSIFITLSIFAGLALGISIFSTVRKKKILSYRSGMILKSIFVISIIMLIGSGIIDHWFILYFYSGMIVLVFLLSMLTSSDFETRFILFCGCFILVSFPFGSSAGIMTAGRYSFWIGLPVALNYLMNIKSINNQFVFYKEDFKNTIQIDITKHQMIVAKNLLLGLLIFVGLYQSYFYPFFDWRNRLQMRYPFGNKLTSGIYTTKGRADALNELLNESSKYVKKGDYLLVYDCMPLVNFITESVPYIRSAYPWLYEANIFKSELDLAVTQKKVLPVVVVQNIQTIGNGSKWPEELLPTDYSKWEDNLDRNKYMNEFLKDNNYQQVWTNGYFKILIPNQNKN